MAPSKPKKARTPRRRKKPAKARAKLFRERQIQVANILDDTFGRWAESHPDVWSHRAYLMLAGVVYQWLATGDHELSTAQLVALAKVLSEGRRGASRSGETAPSAGTPGADGESTTQRPLTDAVRELYGTNLKDPKP